MLPRRLVPASTCAGIRPEAARSRTNRQFIACMSCSPARAAVREIRKQVAEIDAAALTPADIDQEIAASRRARRQRAPRGRRARPGRRPASLHDVLTWLA